MRILSRFLILFCLLFLLRIEILAHELFDIPIELKEQFECNLNEFCKNFLQDIDIENYIRSEMKMDYVVVSLDECIDVALKNNFNIAILEREYQSSKYEYQNALSKFLPILNTTSYISDYRGQILVGGVLRDQFHETAISVNITAQHDLTQGGKTVFEAKAKKYFLKSQKHKLTYLKTQVIF